MGLGFVGFSFKTVRPREKRNWLKQEITHQVAFIAAHRGDPPNNKESRHMFALAEFSCSTLLFIGIYFDKGIKSSE